MDFIDGMDYIDGMDFIDGMNYYRLNINISSEGNKNLF